MADELKKKWSLYDVFHKIMEEERMGILFIKGHEIDMEIGFQEGKIVSVQNPPINEVSIIKKLRKLNLIDDPKIKQLQKLSEKQKISLSQLIIYDKELSASMAIKVIDIELKEALLDLFLRTGINCKFIWEKLSGQKLKNPISIILLLKEAKGRAKKWPELLKKIPHTDLIFEKVGSLPVEEKKEKEEGEISWEELPLSGYERIVFFYVNGERTIDEIKEESGIGEFETIKAIYNLFEKGFIREVKSQIPPKKKKQRSKFYIYLNRIIFNFVLLIGSLLIAFGITALLKHFPPYYRISKDEIIKKIDNVELLKLDGAINLYFTIKGNIPRDMGSLVEAGLISSDDPVVKKWTLLKAGRGYVIKRKTPQGREKTK